MLSVIVYRLRYNNAPDVTCDGVFSFTVTYITVKCAVRIQHRYSTPSSVSLMNWGLERAWEGIRAGRDTEQGGKQSREGNRAGRETEQGGKQSREGNRAGRETEQGGKQSREGNRAGVSREGNRAGVSREGKGRKKRWDGSRVLGKG